MASLGLNSISSAAYAAYSVLANKVNFSYKPIGVTIDWATVTAVASSSTLDSGYVTTVGEKVIPAGSVLYKVTPGTGQSKYGYAVAATSLVRGETFINEHDIYQNTSLDQVGTVFDNGNVFLSRLKLGGAGPTLANVLAACPALRPFKD